MICGMTHCKSTLCEKSTMWQSVKCKNFPASKFLPTTFQKTFIKFRIFLQKIQKLELSRNINVQNLLRLRSWVSKSHNVRKTQGLQKNLASWTTVKILTRWEVTDYLASFHQWYILIQWRYDLNQCSQSLPWKKKPNKNIRHSLKNNARSFSSQSHKLCWGDEVLTLLFREIVFQLCW